MRTVYLDHNATTPIKPHIAEGMLPYLSTIYGNPSSIHSAGRRARQGLMEARDQVAQALGVLADQIVFTSGGTEANNLALLGSFEALKQKGNHLITTAIEHKSVLDCCESLKRRGAKITYITVYNDGVINLEELKKSITDQTILISVQWANNETGVIQPIEQISAIAREKEILFHVDAVQAFGKIPMMAELADMITVSAHKIYGPKGVGALYLKKGLKLEALIHGGNQERKRRGGTENVAAAVGFGLACVDLDQLQDIKRLELLRNQLESDILKEIPQSVINGSHRERTPNTSNISFEGIEGEGLLLNLDLQGICASSGSACSSGSLEPSHVLCAMGHSQTSALSSVRLSLGSETSEEDVRYTVQTLKQIIAEMRELQS